MDDGECKRKPSRGLGLCLVILFTFLKVSHAFDTEIENMRQEGLEKHDISIFVEERVEYIHSRITLLPLINSVEYGRKMSTTFDARAKSSLGKVLSARVEKMAAKVDKKLTAMHNRQIPITQRQKRAIEFVGNHISRLFGNPGPEEWRQNNRNILAMKAAIDRQLSNSVILHKDIDQNRHAINEQNEILKHICRDVVNNDNRLDSVDNALTEFESYLELETMFDSIEDILESLEDIKHDAKSSRCNEKGMNPDFLIEHLREIESNKIGIAPIFASWEWQKYYNFEMCTLALHDNELWITLRIPIVNLAEQMIRTIPSSSQTWIMSQANTIGIEISMFKSKLMDNFMVITKSNLETCSKLGSTRVCNVRKTKFKESNPYIVPIDIGHSRILVLANSSESVTNVKSVCTSETNSLLVQGHAVLKIPEKCAIVAKSFEISKTAELKGLTSLIDIGQVDRVTLHQIRTKNATNRVDIGLAKLPETSKNFFLNNNKTRLALDMINTKPFTTTETMLITTSSATMVLVISVVIVVAMMRCSKKCTQQRSDTPVVVIVDENGKKVKNVMNQIKDESTNFDGTISENAENATFIEQNDQVSDRFDNQSKKPTKPAFQIKK